jgi:hypothetical protein
MRDLRIAETHAVSGAGINGTQAVWISSRL